MSAKAPNQVLEAMGRTDSWLISAVVSGMEIVDLGVVVATDQRTVDVQHAVVQQAAGVKLPATVTRSVEVVWLFAGTWNVAVGDAVLLLGLKDYVARADGASAGPTDVPLHYSQETMKALPLYPSSRGARIQVDAGGLFHVKNASASLFTVLQTLIQGIQGATAGGNPIVDATTKIAQALTQLGQLMGA